MRIFVAGGTGAVGRQLVPQLIARGHEVTAISRAPDKLALLEKLGARAVVCDVFDRERLIAVVAAARPETIVNQLTELPQEMNPRALRDVYRRNDRVRREGTTATSACGWRPTENWGSSWTRTPVAPTTATSPAPRR